MAYTKMNVAPVPRDNSEKEEFAWEYKESLATPSNGISILIPAGCNQITVTLHITGGSGKVQTTTYPVQEVINDTAEWVDWDNGEIATTTQDECPPVTAIRQVNIFGTTILTLRVQ